MKSRVWVLVQGREWNRHPYAFWSSWKDALTISVQAPGGHLKPSMIQIGENLSFLQHCITLKWPLRTMESLTCNFFVALFLVSLFFTDCKHFQNTFFYMYVFLKYFFSSFWKPRCPRISTQHNTDDVRILSPFLLTFSKKIEGNSGKALCLIMNVSFRSTAITREKCDSSIHYLYTSHTRGLLDCISMWPWRQCSHSSWHEFGKRLAISLIKDPSGKLGLTMLDTGCTRSEDC